MIISPPFLPDREDGQSDDDWIDTCMAGDVPRLGAYPLSYKLCWHGGLHLTAPVGYYGVEQRVRAIADGMVVYLRRPTGRPAGELPADHVCAYGGGWTDDGVIVIKHTTEIGEGATAAVTFYSICVHLSAIDEALALKTRVYRKDVLGNAGQIVGAPRRIHLEIVCDDANLERLIGRRTEALPRTGNGRTDVLYGESYYFVPAGTEFFAEEPLCHSAAAMQLQPVAGKKEPVAAAMKPLGTTQNELFVGVDYVDGDRWVTTYCADGTRVGDPLCESEVEYELYGTAMKISAAYPAGGRPIPSAVLELLRLGRVIGTETLLPANVPHWRKIRHAGGEGWVNLNDAKVQRFSDADFPPWRGWCVIDGSSGQDSRCDSAVIRKWLDVNGDGKVQHDEAEARLSDRGVRARLKKTICKFHSEWDSTGFEQRWAWLRQPSVDLDQPMSDATFERMRAHVNALAFWNEEAIGIPAVHWRFEPREFIRQFRKCGWLSKEEMIQLVPDHSIRTATENQKTVVHWEPIPKINVNEEKNPVLKNHRVPLNKMMRKYGIDTPMRQACFFGNALQETKWLGALTEDYGTTRWYAPWYGRGFLQLTHPGNYCEYWEWRGRAVDKALSAALNKAHKEISDTKPESRTNEKLKDEHFPALTTQMKGWRDNVQAAPDPEKAEEKMSPSDSAGFYWVKNKMAMYADLPHVLERRAVSTDGGQKIYNRSPAFWKASAAVNLPGAIERSDYSGLNGFDTRCCVYGVALAVLSEVKFPDGSGLLVNGFPEGFTPRRS